MCRHSNFQPLGTGRDLEVSLQAQVHLQAVEDGARLGVVAHLLQRHGRPEHGARELLAAFGIVFCDPHLVMRGKPAAKALGEQRLGNRRQRHEPPIGQERRVGRQHVHVGVEVRQVPEGLHEQDQHEPSAGCRFGVRIDEQSGRSGGENLEMLKEDSLNIASWRPKRT